MDRALLVRPLPLRGEGLRGYFLRLSEVNGLLPEFDLHRTLPGQRRAQSVAAAATTAASLGLDPAGIARLGCGALEHDGTRLQHRGHTISVRYLRGRQCAVCPRCLAAQAAIWADWELAAQVACPIHRCWLVDCCPGCGSEVAWRRQGVATCQCGYDLRRILAGDAPADAVCLATVIRHRLFADLPSAAELQQGVPDFLVRCPFNELLGLFHFFRSPALRSISGSPNRLTNATLALQSQVAAVSMTHRALADWPTSWRQMIDLLAVPTRAAFPTVDDGACHIIGVREARAPYHFMRAGRSASEEFPREIRAEVESLIQARAVLVGHRRLYAASELRRSRSDRGAQRLTHLLVTINRGHHIFASDRLSPDAVQELFDATPFQVRALRRVGALPKFDWPTAKEVDRGMAMLARFARARRPTVDRDMVRLSEISVDAGGELEVHLRDAMSGRTPLVYWGSMRTPTLRNLFIPRAYALEATGRSLRGRV